MGRNKNDVTRRDFLQRLSAIGVAGIGGGALLSACGGDAEQGETADADSCDDLSELSDDEREQREQMVETLSYVDETPNEDQYCANCALYIEPEDEETTGDQCGGCDLFPGPVHPDGYCTSWAPA